MAALEETIIEISKKKTVLILTGTIAFVAIGIWMLTLDPERAMNYSRYRSPEFVYGFGIVSIIFFGLGGMILVKRLFNSSPGIILSQDGFTDNASGVSVSFVPWSEVVEIRSTAIRVGTYPKVKQKFVSVYVNDPEKFANKGNLLQRKTNRLSEKMTGTTINISANILKIDHEKLHSTFQRYFSNYRGTT